MYSFRHIWVARADTVSKTWCLQTSKKTSEKCLKTNIFHSETVSFLDFFFNWNLYSVNRCTLFLFLFQRLGDISYQLILTSLNYSCAVCSFLALGYIANMGIYIAINNTYNWPLAKLSSEINSSFLLLSYKPLIRIKNGQQDIHRIHKIFLVVMVVEFKDLLMKNNKINR